MYRQRERKLFWLEVLQDQHCHGIHSDLNVIFQKEGKILYLISTEIIVINNCVLVLGK